MNRYDLKSWEEFEPAINEIRKKYPKVKILYRGGDADNKNDHLKTSLERFREDRWTLKNYSSFVLGFAPQIEAHFDLQLNLPTWPEVGKVLDEKYTDDYMYFPPKLYAYFIYLRQHGFPSPLLDWTDSPYIAAYFAFAEKKSIDRNAVFIFIESPSPYNVKTRWGSNNGGISIWGPEIKTHKRHFLQRALYTVATKNLPENRDWEFIPHDDFYEEHIEGESDGLQDILIKITLPASERPKVLTYLDQYNLNQFSLFQTEDDLIKTIIFREMEKNKES